MRRHFAATPLHPGAAAMPRRADQANVVRLTRPAIAAITLNPGQSERIVWDAEVQGFGYRLRGGRGTWVIRPPRAGGKSSLFTLGAADAISLTEARTAAKTRLAQAALGDSPALARREQRAAAVVTLESILTRYECEAKDRMRASSLANLRTHVGKHWQPLHDRPLASIRRADIATRLQEISQGSGKHAAVRARRMLSSVFAWAVAEGMVDANPVTGTRPAAEEVRRERVLSSSELAAIWKGVSDDDFGRIIKLLMLTGMRRSEVAEMRWSELDLDGAMWRLPGSRTKNKRPHEVPLSHAAIEILQQVAQRSERDLVFGNGSGGFSGFSKSKKALDDELGLEDWHIHDLRRTAATGMADLGVLPHVVEAALNHVSGHKAGVAGIYNRATYSPEKRDALDRWGREIERICAPAE